MALGLRSATNESELSRGCAAEATRADAQQHEHCRWSGSADTKAKLGSQFELLHFHAQRY